MGGALELEHRIHSHLREHLLVLGEHLGRERGLRDALQVIAEGLLVRRVVEGHTLECLARHIRRAAVARDDKLRVQLLLHELLRLAQQLPCEHAHTRGAVAHLLVLGLGDVDEEFGGGVVDEDALEDGGSIIGHLHLIRRPGPRLQDLVHALGPQGGLHHVSDGEGTDDGRHACMLSSSLARARLEYVDAARHAAILEHGCERR
mmetsp:Transcript_21072/g.56744  ORF Transcript_21072/g.56744 Transcript_21072/m.56744 type:complete len:204 (-) Transcript_21072:64-675(-)